MAAGHLDLASPVAPVLPEQVAHALPAVPVDSQVGIEQELVASRSDPPVELEVLVDDELLVPPTELADQRERVGPERDVLHRLGRRAVVIGGVPDPERRGHGGGDGAAGRRHADTVLPAPDPAPAPLLESGDGLGHVVRRDRGMGVDPHQPRRGGRSHGQVQADRDDATRVVEELDPRIARCVVGDDGRGRIVGIPVDDDHLELGLGLRQQRIEAMPDELGLVAGGDDHGGDGRHLGRLRPVTISSAQAATVGGRKHHHT